MKNYGLKLVPRDPLDFCYTLGASKIHKEVRREDGNWVKDLPDGEIQQRSGFESFSCVSFATLNIAEILQWVKFGIRSNYSDRFLSTMSETTDQGNDPKKVADAFRHAGAVPESDWPFTNEIDTFDKFHAPSPLSVRNKGIQWLKDYEIGYEWVTPTPENLMEELRYSPLGIAVEAWQEKDGLYYGGENPNHWTCLVGYVEGKHWVVFDSYPETGGSYLKNLAWDYSFKIVMSYSLKKKSQEEKSWFQNILDFLNEIFFEYMKRRY